MQVELTLVGLPTLGEVLGGNPVSVSLECGTVGELLHTLQRDHGEAAGVRLLDTAGQVDPDVLVICNGRHPIPRNALSYRLADGDQITLAVILAGG